MVKIRSAYPRHELELFPKKKFSLIQRTIEYRKKFFAEEFCPKLSILSPLYILVSGIMMRKFTYFLILIIVILPFLQLVIELPYGHDFLVKIEKIRVKILTWFGISFILLFALQYSICYVAGSDFFDKYETKQCPLCEEKYSNRISRSHYADKKCKACAGLGLVVDERPLDQ